MIGSGSQPDAGAAAPASASSSLAVGRCAGFFSRHRATSGRIWAGTPASCAGECTTRYTSAAVGPLPNGTSPEAANARIAPRLKTSLGGPTSAPIACSGDMNPGEPITRPARVTDVFSAAREMPKSITRGPSSASRTFDGLRSRCTTPAAWIAVRPSARPAASASTDPGSSGPWPRTASASDGPGTYAVASHGSAASISASTTTAVYRPLTRRAAVTSCRNRTRKSWSAASSARITFTATRLPPADRPRNTRPIPPAPSSATRRYGPICRGSPGWSSRITPISTQHRQQ